MKRFLLLLLLPVLGLFLQTSSASAGTYKVIQCGAGIANDGAVNTSFIGGGLDINSSCSTTNVNQWVAAESGFLRFRTLAGGTTVPQGRQARFSWVMPEGIEIVSWSGYFKVEGEMSSGWRMRIIRVAADGTETIDKNMCTNASACSGNNQLPIANIGWERKQTSAGAAFKELKLQLICGAAEGCAQNSTAANIKVNSFQFLTSDTVDPTVSSISGPLTTGAWVRGTQQIQIDGLDSQSGLYGARLLRPTDGAVLATDTLGASCSLYSNTLPELDGENGRTFQPCPTTAQQRAISLNTVNLPSTGQFLSFCLQDFSGNESCRIFVARIDNIAPLASPSPNPAQAGKTLDMQTVALDGQSGVEKVEYRIASFAGQATIDSTTPVCTVSAAPYACTIDWGGFSTGNRGVVQVRTYDNAGNITNQLLSGPSNIGIEIDRTPPVVEITSTPEENSSTAIFDFTADDPSTTFYCSLDGSEPALCLSPVAYQNLAEGEHTFSVYGVDSLGNASQPIEHSWSVDTSKPEVEITLAPSNPSNSASATFEFSVSGEYSEAQCSLDGSAWSVCSSPVEYTGLSRGNHLFQVRALSRFGEPGPAQNYAWTVAADPASVQIVSGPPASSSSASAQFVFQSSTASAFECKLDSGAWQACSSPQDYSELQDGLHVFEVRALNALGEPGPESIYVWQVDTVVSPVVTLEEKPTDPSSSSVASFSWSIDGANNGTQCSLDGSAWQECTSPQQYSGLVRGNHIFQVRALDTRGNPGEPITYSWLIEASAPGVEIISGPATLSASASAQFIFEAEGSAAGYECRLDGGEWEACLSPKEYSDLEDGLHVFEVRSLSALGEAGQPTVYSWIVDALVTPEVELLLAPPPVSQSSAAVFEFEASGDWQTLLCSLDGAAWQECSSPQEYDNLRPGNHFFQVRAVDTKGNSGPITSYSWQIELLPPAVEILSGPETETASTSAEFVFEAEGVVVGYECSLDGAAWQTCTSPVDYSGLSLGVHTFRVRAIDSFSNAGPVDFYAWHISAPEPERVEIISGPDRPSASSSATFQFVADGETECSLDGAAWQPCTSPQTYSDLERGLHLFQVRVPGGPATSYGWRVEATYPEVEILSGPSSPTTSTSAQFTFQSDIPAESFQCRLDGSAWQECSSPLDYSDLSQGIHLFEVRALNSIGEAGEPAAYAWYVTDASAPTVSLTSTPPNPSASSTAVFRFEVEGEADRVECSLDGSAWEECSEEKTYTGLSGGSHLFQVRAVLGAETGPATSYSWKIEGVSAGVEILSGPPSKTDSQDAQFVFSATGESSGFQCRLDGGEWQECTSPKDYAGLGEGIHVFEVRALDGAGDPGEPTVYAWLIDSSTLPTVTITSAPEDPTNSSQATFAWVSTGESTECSLDGSPWQACTSPKTYNNLDRGNHVFAVRALDGEGNPGPIAAFSWLVSDDLPEVEILSGPDVQTTSTVAQFIFSSSSSSLQCRLDGSEWQACSSPKSYSDLTLGIHLFEVRALNALGEAGEAAAYPWLVEEPAPATVEILSGPSSTSSSPEATFEFTASEPYDKIECSLDGDAWRDCTSPVVYTSLANGNHVFQVRAVRGGEAGPAETYVWSVEVTVPDTEIVSGPSASTTDSSAQFVFQAPGASGFQCRLDGGEWQECTSPKEYSDLQPGVHTFEVRAEDAEGNVGNSTVYGWLVESNLPVATITSGPDNPSSSNQAEFLWTISGEYEKSECSLDGGAWQECVSGITLTGLKKGGHVFRVRAVTESGQAGPAGVYGWQITADPLSVTITSGPDSTSSSTSAQFVFEADGEASGYQCRLNSGEWQECSSPKNYTDLTDGVYLFQVRALNSLGEPGEETSYAWVVDAVQVPLVIITEKPAALSDSERATFAWQVEGASSGSECALDGQAWQTCSSPALYQGLAEGNHIFRVRALDSEGKPGPEEVYSWVVDTKVPGVEITSAPSSITTSSSAEFQFSAEGEVDSYECRLDGGNWGACSSPQGYQNVAPGVHVFQVRAIRGENTGPETVYVWVVREEVPQITLTEYPTNPSTQPVATFNWQVDEDVEGFECSLNGSEFTSCAGPMTYENIPSGGNVFQVRPILPGGETGDPTVYAWQAGAPEISITLTKKPAAQTDQKDAMFEWTAEGASGYRCRLDSAPEWEPCTSPLQYGNLQDGAHTFQVQALNVFGEPGPITAWGWNVDSAGKKCKISAIRSRLFIFRNQNVIRLVANYRATDSGSAWIYFYKRLPGNKFGKRVAAVRFRFAKKGKTTVVRIRQKESAKKMKILRNYRKGFLAVADVQNAPSYCRSNFARNMVLTQKRNIRKQIVWFERGTFK